MSRITRGWGVGILAGMLWFGTVAADGQGADHPDAGKVQHVSPAKQSKTKAESESHSKLVSVELVIAEVAPKKADAVKPVPVEKEFDASELTGPMNQVLARVETLKNSGRISYLRRIQLSVTEGQQAVVNVGAMKPLVSGTNVTGTGHVSRSITYRNTGTMLKLTPRVTADNRVLIDLNLEDSGMRMSEDGVSLGTDEQKQPIPAAEMTIAKLDSRLSVRSGQALAAQVVQTATKTGQEQLFVIVAARVGEPESQRDK